MVWKSNIKVIVHKEKEEVSSPIVMEDKENHVSEDFKACSVTVDARTSDNYSYLQNDDVIEV